VPKTVFFYQQHQSNHICSQPSSMFKKAKEGNILKLDNHSKETTQQLFNITIPQSSLRGNFHFVFGWRLNTQHKDQKKWTNEIYWVKIFYSPLKGDSYYLAILFTPPFTPEEFIGQVIQEIQIFIDKNP
jgi:hypothetical protein